MQVNVTGITDILGAGTGHIDVLTNGFITLTEQVGDLRSATSLDRQRRDPDGPGVGRRCDGQHDGRRDRRQHHAGRGGRGHRRRGQLPRDQTCSSFPMAPAEDGRAQGRRAAEYLPRGDRRRPARASRPSTAGNATLVSRKRLDPRRRRRRQPGHRRPLLPRRRRPRTRRGQRQRVQDRPRGRGAGSIGTDGDDLDIDSRTGGRLVCRGGHERLHHRGRRRARRARGAALAAAAPDGARHLGRRHREPGAAARRRRARARKRRHDGAPGRDQGTDLDRPLGRRQRVHRRQQPHPQRHRDGHGQGITIRGDTRRVGKTNDVDDPERRRRPRHAMDLRGTIGLDAPVGPRHAHRDRPRISPRSTATTDVDTFTFNQTDLDANTDRPRQPEVRWRDAARARRRGPVHRQPARVDARRPQWRGDTLTLDGQSGQRLLLVKHRRQPGRGGGPAQLRHQRARHRRQGQRRRRAEGRRLRRQRSDPASPPTTSSCCGA